MKARLASSYQKTFRRPLLRMFLLILGAPLTLAVWFSMLAKRSHLEALTRPLEEDSRGKDLEKAHRQKLYDSERHRRRFFGESQDPASIEAVVDRQMKKEFPAIKRKWIQERLLEQGHEHTTFLSEMDRWWREKPLALLLGVFLLPMLLVYSVPTLEFIVQRLLMMVFVILGVTVIVFTLMYLSPSDPAINILGNQAAPASVENFRRVHGLDLPYLHQLWRTIKGIFTFDLGLSYEGNLPVVLSILRRFPVTLQLTLMALSISLLVALPAGIYAAVNSNSTFDHLFMLVALIGISIPSFWQGLLFILAFSIRLGWLPATYSAANHLSLLMPAFILGTVLMASVARMTRSSTLEVINEDYILTARSKGLPRRRVILRHAVPNALIPIITVIGLQLGGMLGGSAVTEKVFNISGVGSYIVDKQFVPDIPSIIAGVIYIAIILSVVNLAVDLLYSFIDPRIRSRIRSGQLK